MRLMQISEYATQKSLRTDSKQVYEQTLNRAPQRVNKNATLRFGALPLCLPLCPCACRAAPVPAALPLCLPLFPCAC